MSKLLTRSNLRGVWHALIMPWDKNDQIVESLLREQIRRVAKAGVHGVYTGGTTGEFYAQDDATYAQITKIVCDEAAKHNLPVQIGCTALSLRTTLLRAKVAKDAGAAGLQVAIPFWLELKDDEVMDFMRGLEAGAGGVPIILYNTSRCKRKVLPDMIGKLRDELPTFIGMKDTGCDVPTLKAMLAVAPDIAIFSGENDLTEKMAAGGKGTYSSVTGLCAPAVVDLYNLLATGRLDQAKPLQTAIYRVLFESLIPMVTDEGLLDSAVDRVQMIAGGLDIGVKCQRPYRSATMAHVERVKAWVKANTPILLPRN
jgi:dihydrodipicolinate synthase/N-acetylneuraminate lyase